MKHNKALYKTIKKMVPAVLIAMISTALGLLSLYRSKVPMINDFGAMLTIGIVIAFMIAIFIFIPFLYIRDKHFPTVEHKKVKQIKPNGFISSFVGVIIKFKFLILSIAIVLALVGLYVDQSAEAETDLENFMPQDSEALEDIQTLRSIIGSTEQIAIILESEYILTKENFMLIDEIENSLFVEQEDKIIETSSLINMFEMMGIKDYDMINEDTLKKFQKTK